MKTAETLKKVKTQKKEIVNLFENAAVSRKNDGIQGFEPEHESELDSEHWFFWLGGNENQFQASNCSKCGNYSPEHAYDYMPQNILCSCGGEHDFHPNQEEDDDQPDDQQDDTESYDEGDEPDIDRYEYFEQYYNDSDLEEEEQPEQAIEQAIQEQKEWDSETEENPIELMRRRQIRRMAEIEGEGYYYTYFRYRYK